MNLNNGIDFLSYFGLKRFYNWLKNKDIEEARKIGEAIALGWYKIDRRRRQLAENNIKFALNASELQAKEIAKENFLHYGKIIGEIGKWEEIYSKSDQFFNLKNFSYVEELKGKEKTKGFILLTGHIGNWEIATIAFTKYIGSGTAIVKKIHNQYINDFITNMRKEMGLELISEKNTVFKMMRKIRNGEILIFLLDQNAPLKEAVFVDFFGKPASTFKVVALLSLRFNIPVLPAYCIRNQQGTFDINFEKPIYPQRTDNIEHDILLNTQAYTNFIEKVIIKHPEQWFWVHNRWKNQPLEKV